MNVNESILAAISKSIDDAFEGRGGISDYRMGFAFEFMVRRIECPEPITGDANVDLPCIVRRALAGTATEADLARTTELLAPGGMDC